jgi:ribulose-5-phosphate 4-epimerase/fuculose-1-phosphate aldolase
MATRHANVAPAVLRNSDLDDEAVRNARVDLAACFRMAARLGLHEGICNHFSFVVPGRDDLFWSTPTAGPSPR